MNLSQLSVIQNRLIPNMIKSDISLHHAFVSNLYIIIAHHSTCSMTKLYERVFTFFTSHNQRLLMNLGLMLQIIHKTSSCLIVFKYFSAITLNIWGYVHAGSTLISNPLGILWSIYGPKLDIDVPEDFPAYKSVRISGAPFTDMDLY